MTLSDKIKEVVRIEDLANKLGYPMQRNGFCFSIYKQEKTPTIQFSIASIGKYIRGSHRVGGVSDDF